MSVEWISHFNLAAASGLIIFSWLVGALLEWHPSVSGGGGGGEGRNGRETANDGRQARRARRIPLGPPLPCLQNFCGCPPTPLGKFHESVRICIIICELLSMQTTAEFPDRIFLHACAPRRIARTYQGRVRIELKQEFSASDAAFATLAADGALNEVHAHHIDDVASAAPNVISATQQTKHERGVLLSPVQRQTTGESVCV